MYKSRNKQDLIIEVWEKLDCENVGAREIIEIEEAVRKQFGSAAVESPMVIARLLADEGAELRHSEIMSLYVKRKEDRPYDAVFRNVIDLSDFRSSLTTIRNLENLRKKFQADNDKEGLRLLLELTRDAKNDLAAKAGGKRLDPTEGAKNTEIAEWLTIWLGSPEIFENWISLRTKSKEFVDKFGSAKD